MYKPAWSLLLLHSPPSGFLTPRCTAGAKQLWAVGFSCSLAHDVTRTPLTDQDFRLGGSLALRCASAPWGAGELHPDTAALGAAALPQGSRLGGQLSACSRLLPAPREAGYHSFAILEPSLMLRANSKHFARGQLSVARLHCGAGLDLWVLEDGRRGEVQRGGQGERTALGAAGTALPLQPCGLLRGSSATRLSRWGAAGKAAGCKRQRIGKNAQQRPSWERCGSPQMAAQFCTDPCVTDMKCEHGHCTTDASAHGE